jgi:hypothetical protein
MRYAVVLSTVFAATMAATAAAPGQVASHMFGPDTPDVVTPVWVTKPPAYFDRSLEATPPENAAQPSAAGSPSTLPDDARQAIRLAEGANWAEAAAAGKAVLAKPLTHGTDYMWDYVGNATAWALLQTGKKDEAADAHTAAASRIRDTDLRTAHRLVAGILKKTEKPADRLKDPAAYKAELHAHLADRIDRARNLTKAARESTSGKTLLLRWKQAYGEVRILTAVDPDLGRRLRQEHLVPAADALMDLAAAAMNEGRAAVKRLEDRYHDLYPHRITGEWNSMLHALWHKVEEVKSLCRIHEYLASKNLATGGRARGPFAEAHRLLFAEGNSLVWQPIGFTRFVNDIAQKDLRRKVRWQETPIAPLGVALAQRTTESPQGFRRLDKMDGDDFRTMEGGGWNTMDGGGWKTMDGGGWNKMDGGGWNKMDDGGWQRR